MKILLAPMEGVVDPVLRNLLTAIGGIDYCVTEFIRVTDKLNPAKVFYRYCPELLDNGHTPSGTPVFVQLLGGQPQPMAENAAMACALGAYGIDLNFGCPAKTVNRHDGGAALLKNPDRVFAVTSAVRNATPKNIPVTVKVRLGFADKSYVTEIAQAAEAGGGHWLTVHARTKEEGYRPPAHWQYIAQMRQAVAIPVIANGEIWTPADHRRCQEVSGCTDTMIGRGLVAQPDLAWAIKTGQALRQWWQWSDFFHQFVAQSREYRNDKYALTRSKQLTKLMSRSYPEFKELFDKIKRLQECYRLENTITQFFEVAHAPTLYHSPSADAFLSDPLSQ